jgi:hypothetical protein
MGQGCTLLLLLPPPFRWRLTIRNGLATFQL